MIIQRGLNRKKIFIYLFIPIFIFSCKELPDESLSLEKSVEINILGSVQDGGIPHLGCEKSCCKDYFEKGFSEKRVVSLGISDHFKNKNYIIEASPDIAFQLNDFLTNKSKKLDGIFITHAHIGHYSGLINLGREVSNASEICLLYTSPSPRD